MNNFGKLLRKELPEETVSQALELQSAGNEKDLALLSAQLLQGFWNVIGSEAYRSVDNEAMTSRNYFEGLSAEGERIRFKPQYCGVTVQTMQDVANRYPGAGVTYFFAEYKDASRPDYAGFVESMARLNVNIPSAMQSFIEHAKFMNGLAISNVRQAQQPRESKREKAIKRLDKEDYLRRMDEGLTSAHFLVTGHSVNKF
ncbi:hypothetical protein HZA97_08305 [Candidatus Woesearchaeota archaeon]|nr:hypothetical protein [Candidatus Woesearchaeota archaeon]